MKPWGPLDWLLGKLYVSNFVVVGCLAAEERSVTVPIALHEKGARRTSLLNIDDGEPVYAKEIAAKIGANRKELSEIAVAWEEDIHLLARDEDIATAFELLVGDGEGGLSLILDISCIPKRFFFLMVKLAMMETRIDNVIVTYTQAGSSGYTAGHLADNPDDVRPIPGYAPGRGAPSTLIVGVGFESLGLPELVEEYRHNKRHVEVLVPFPPGQPYSRRIWQTVQKLGIGAEENRVHRVNALDAFGTYERIVNLVGEPREGTVAALAPYGPKPVSLGMCLYAVKHDAPVLYTQPRVYHPDYTLGAGDAWGYCLKYAGEWTL